MYLTTKDTKITKIAPSNDACADVSRIVVDCVFKVHKALGPGLLESAYEECLAYELASRNLKTERQKSLPIQYESLKIDNGFRLDMVVEDNLILELKSVEKITPVHTAQINLLKVIGHQDGPSC